MKFRTEALVESRDARIALSDAQAEALAEAGVRLAADKAWWGQAEDEPERSVIQCAPARSGYWWIRVLDAIGIVVVGDVQLVVHPKIPLRHLLYLLEVGDYIPRVSPELGVADADTPLWRLVAQWFVSSTETLLRGDLIRDYRDEEGELIAIRGQVEALETARAYYAGRLRFQCLYDEFGADTALNRMLKGAARVVAGSPLLDEALRRRALRLITRMESVGVLQVSDFRAAIDRRTHHYGQAIGWARNVLLARGRTLGAGDAIVWTFLIRTPAAVEAGIRAILQARFGQAAITNRGRRLEGSHLTINPDLVVDEGMAVADVKYKLSTGEWHRPDLYQLVTFATAFRSSHGGLINFAPAGTRDLTPVEVGDISLSHMPWPADPAIPPAKAAESFGDRVEDWLRRAHPSRAVPA